MRTAQLIVLALTVTLALAACGPKEAAPAAPSAPAAPTPVAIVPAPVRPAPAPSAPAPAKQAWETEWDKTLTAARREGRVFIHTTAGGAVRDALTKIARMQQLEAEIVTMRTPELLPKVLAERRAGLYLTDVVFAGIGTIVNQAKPAGIMEPLDSALIQPHLTDPAVIKQVWYQGQLTWADQDHTVLYVALQPGVAIAINTELVKPDEVKSYRDLLNPKWKDKVAFNDPTIAGYGSLCLQGMYNLVGESYIRELAATKPIIIRDQRLLVEWLAHGKIAMAIAPRVDTVVEFVRAGAPIKAVIPNEGTWMGPAGGGLNSFKNAAHPNATKVFINLITTKEAQDIFAPAGGFHSLRVDASTAHLLPGLARTEGVTYFPAYTEENALKQPITDKLAKDLFGPLIK